MSRLQVILTLDVPDRTTAATKLQQLKDKLAQTNVILSASYSEMLEQPTKQ